MTMSRTSFLSEILGGDPIPLGKRAYFGERLKNRLYDLIITEFMKRGLSKADLARRTGRRPEQITRWLGSPGNWTLDTVSDLLLAMGAELQVGISPLDGRPARNYVAPAWFYDEQEKIRTSAEIRYLTAPAGALSGASVSDASEIRFIPK